MSLQHFKKKFAKKTKFACATALFVIKAKFHLKFLIGKSVNHKKGCGAWKLSLYSSFLSKTLHIWCKEAIKLVLSEIHEMTSYRPPLIILTQPPPYPWIHLLILILSVKSPILVDLIFRASSSSSFLLWLTYLITLLVACAVSQN